MAINPYQAASDAISVGEVEQYMGQVVPVVQQLRSVVPGDLDPETSEVDVDTLPQPLKHLVGCVSSLEQAYAELRRTATAIDPTWTPSDNLQL